VGREVKIIRFVNAVLDSAQPPGVVKRHSGLWVRAFGDKDRYARVFVGVSSPPENLICGNRGDFRGELVD
jgi:hypothetical protein